MKINYTKNQFDSVKSFETLPCICYNCGKDFQVEKKQIKYYLTGKSKKQLKYCSNACKAKDSITKQKVNCTNCQKLFEKTPAELNKSGNNFCSKSCSATYNNTHKSHGTRRSKLECWLQTQLTSLYPDLQIDFNKKAAIGSELDIFIPSLSLAFELNGIFHYEPIFGLNKLGKIQNNDNNKFKACQEANINLCIIDVSSLKYFKPTNTQKYLDIINNIIKELVNQLASQSCF